MITAALAGPSPARPPQWRSFWVDAFRPGLKTPAQVDQLVADLQALNCNAVFAQVRKRGDALYRNSLEPFSDDPSIPADFDPLADLLSKAHAAGIQVHAWVNVNTAWPGSGPDPKSPEHPFRRHGPTAAGRDNWLTCDDTGRTRFDSGYFFDPGHPDSAAHFVRVVRHLAEHYPIDGVHLDYVRYPETEGSMATGFGAGYNPVSVERYRTVLGRSDEPSRSDFTWQQWRRDQVTHLVRRTRAELFAVRPQMALTASVIAWGGGPADEDAWPKSAAYARVFQDWHGWRRDGLLDLVVPMNYDREGVESNRRYFDEWVAFETRFRHRAGIVVGLGGYMNRPEQTREQMRRALASADGVSIFSYAVPQAGDRLPISEWRKLLVEDAGAPFAAAAAVPAVSRDIGILAGVVGRDGASVAVRGPVNWNGTADGNGYFAVVLPPGRYQLVVGERTEDVEVHPGRVTPTPAGGE